MKTLTNKYTYYGNRKLYLSAERRYITLDHVINSVKSGINIEVIDHKTDKDITSDTLSRCIGKLGLSKASLLTIMRGAK